MARGIQIITPYSTYDDRTAADDIIIVQPADFAPPPFAQNPVPSNGHPLPHETDARVVPLPEESRNVTVNESSASRNQVNREERENDLNRSSSSLNEDNSCSTGSTLGNSDFLSSLAHHVPMLGGITQPSLDETRAAGQVLFQQFVQRYASRDLESSFNPEIMEDAIPSDIPEDINRVMQ
jgi:hypothetical protein